jgi:hypothetical protein
MSDATAVKITQARELAGKLADDIGQLSGDERPASLKRVIATQGAALAMTISALADLQRDQDALQSRFEGMQSQLDELAGK